MDQPKKPVTDWQMERLALGELDQATARELELRLGEEGSRERLAELEASNRAILERLPPEMVGAAIRRRVPARRPMRGRLLMALIPVAATVGVWTFSAMPRHASLLDGPGDEIILAKGATRLLAYRAVSKGAAAIRLGPTSVARPHDVVQLAYTTGGAKFGMIISIDGRGVVTQHLPEKQVAAPAPLVATGEVRLPHSYELDDAPGFERFFFVTASQSFSPADVLAAARTLAQTPDEARAHPLPLDAPLSQQSLLLVKVQP
jgi:hypothetical protein